MINDETEFNPDWVSPPGDTIQDLLEEREIEWEAACTGLQLTDAEMKKLISGEMWINLALARRLHDYFGASVEFWMMRDYQYRIDKLTKEAPNYLQKHKKLLSELSEGIINQESLDDFGQVYQDLLKTLGLSR